MAGEIKHKWNGTILTITSDSGTSSCDLKGRQGDDGCRGPQGPAGIILDADGNVIFEGIATEDYVDYKISNLDITANIDLSNYYTKGEIDATISNMELPEVNLSNYYTKAEIDAAIEGVEVDLSDYYTKSQVEALIPSTTGFITMSAVEAKGYQTASQVQTAINNAFAGLDGDGVDY